MNLHKFALSTLTFSLVTALSVAGFSESANAQRKGKKYGRNNNAPLLIFDAIFETDDGKRIEDEFPKLDNIGVFKDAITLQCCTDPLFPSSLNNSAEAGGIFTSREITNLFELPNQNSTPINLSASLDKQTNQVTYQIFVGDVNNYQNPTDFLRFAPINVPDGDFVNNLENIIDSSIPGTYIEGGSDDRFTKPGAGVLGLAIEETINFLPSEDDFDDEFLITQIGSRTTTTIPEPTTTLASLFVLGVSGISLRKRKNNDLI